MPKSDIEERDAKGATTLMHTAAFGSSRAMKLLLDNGAIVNLKNNFDATALLRAAGDPVKARMLIWSYSAHDRCPRRRQFRHSRPPSFKNGQLQT